MVEVEPWVWQEVGGEFRVAMSTDDGRVAAVGLNPGFTLQPMPPAPHDPVARRAGTHGARYARGRPSRVGDRTNGHPARGLDRRGVERNDCPRDVADVGYVAVVGGLVSLSLSY